jgi:hypothetical protein
VVADVQERHAQDVHEDVPHHAEQVFESQQEALFHGTDGPVLKLVPKRGGWDGRINGGFGKLCDFL